MTARRDFLKQTSAATAGAWVTDVSHATVPLANGSYSGSGLMPASVRLVLSPESRAILEPALARSGVPVDWAHRYGLMFWDAGEIRMSSAFTAASCAMATPNSSGGVSKALASCSNNAVGLLSHAVVLGVRPYGMLINLSKARRMGVVGTDFMGLKYSDIKPVFPLNLSGCAAENSWVVPLFDSAGLLARDFLEYRSEECDIEALERLLRSVIAGLSVRVVRGLPDQVDLGRLLDPTVDEEVALYGDPLALHRALHSRDHPEASEQDFTVVSLQDFFGISSPSFFASTMLQVGAQVSPRKAQRLIQTILEAVGQHPPFELAFGAPPDQASPVLVSQWEALRATHDRDAYTGRPGMEFFTDRGALVSLLLTATRFVGGSASGQNQKLRDVAIWSLNEARADYFLRRA